MIYIKNPNTILLRSKSLNIVSPFNVYEKLTLQTLSFMEGFTLPQAGGFTPSQTGKHFDKCRSVKIIRKSVSWNTHSAVRIQAPDVPANFVIFSCHVRDRRFYCTNFWNNGLFSRIFPFVSHVVISPTKIKIIIYENVRHASRVSLFNSPSCLINRSI